MQERSHRLMTRVVPTLVCCGLLAVLLSSCLGPDSTPTVPGPPAAPTTTAPTTTAVSPPTTGTSNKLAATVTAAAALTLGPTAPASSQAQPPGWPGDSAVWTTGSKQGLG